MTPRASRRAFARAAAAAAVAGRPGTAYAAAKVTLRVDRVRASVGERIEVEVEVTAASAGDIGDPELAPVLRDPTAFTVRGPQTYGSRSLNIVNGRRFSEVKYTYSYDVHVKKAGTFDLSATVQVAGQKQSSNSATLTVTELEAQSGVADGALETEAREDRDGFFLWASVDQAEPFVGQAVRYRVAVYSRRDGRLRFGFPSFQGFESTAAADPGGQQVELAGRNYGVEAKEFICVPLKSGELVIEAAVAQLTTSRGLFGDTLSAESNPVAVKVKPLPSAGRPADFVPTNVGTFEIEASVDRAEVRQGEPLTLTVVLKGSGNIAAADLHWPDMPGLRRYDPNIDKDMTGPTEGTKTFRALVIPETSGGVSIPSLHLDYFDPESGRYLRASTAPIPLKVEARAGAGDASSSSAPQPATAGAAPGTVSGFELPLASDVLGPDWRVDETSLAGAIGTLAIPVGLAGAGLAGSAAVRRFGEGAEARHQRRRRQQRRKELRAAASQSAREAGALVARVLQEAAVERLGADAAGLPRDQLLRRMRDSGSAEDLVRRLGELLESCDRVRFGAGEGAAASLCERGIEVLTLLESEA